MCSRQQTLPPGDSIGNLLRKFNDAGARFVDTFRSGTLPARLPSRLYTVGDAGLTVQFITCGDCTPTCPLISYISHLFFISR